MTQLVRIATRKSPLALWQAEYVKTQLLSHFPNLQVEILAMSTKGDKLLGTSLSKVGGKGLFVKELEVAILEHKADLAVHSMKDVPMEFPRGLSLGIICKREDPSAAIDSNDYSRQEQLPQGSVVGTSSLRRQSQIRAHFPHLQIKDLRGNVNTRLAKLDQGDYDALILASAGLIRLEMEHRITSRLDPSHCLPAAGQGAGGGEWRSEDKEVLQLLQPLQHQQSAHCVLAERAMNRSLQGGCQVPIGCFAQLDTSGSIMTIQGLVASVDGQTLLKADIKGAVSEAERLGEKLADKLLAMGAGEILASVYGS